MVSCQILCLTTLLISLGACKASLRDILSSALAHVRKIIFSPEDDEESKIWNIIDDACNILENLTKELDRLGKNAYVSAVRSKDKGFQEKASSCAAKKGSLANGVFKIKRQQLKKCYNASASLVYDFAESFIKSNQATVNLNLGKELMCKDDSDCIGLKTLSSDSSETYETWGSRLSAVHRCTQDTISHATTEYMLIFKGLRHECLSCDFVIRKRIALNPSGNTTKNVKIPRPRSRKEAVLKLPPK